MMMKKNNDMENKNPFRVPDNYFEEVNRKIIEATSGGKNVREKKTVYARLKPVLAIAASVAILTLITYTGIKTFQSERKPLKINDWTEDQISEMIINDLDITTLEQNFEMRDVPFAGPGVDKKDIVDYLLLDNIDINEIFDLL